jgi:hypothetical protein
MTPRHAAQSTFDALLWQLREHGVERLNEDATRNRLAQLSGAQVQQLIAALERLRSRYARTITDELIAALKEQLQ